jgi:uncharacterized protein (TIGR02266 family)
MSSNDNDLGAISVASRLLNLVLDLPIEKQLELLKIMDNLQQKGARKNKRRSWKIAVEFTDGNRVMRDYIKDISSGGVFIETKMPLTVGQDLNLKFPLPNYRKLVKVAGEIVWTSPEGIGVKFKR